MSHPIESRRLPNSSPKTSGRTVFGYAARYNVKSRPLMANGREFVEILERGCFPNLAEQDCRALFNHSEHGVLARSKNGRGSLKLEVDSVGLRFEFESPRTTVSEDLLESIRRGDLDETSFAFIVADDGASFSTEGGVRIRRVKKIKTLLDVSIVNTGAYPGSNVAARSAAKYAGSKAEVEDWAARLGLK